MSNKIESKNDRLCGLIAHIEEVNDFIRLLNGNNAKPSTIEEYQFLRSELIKELNDVLKDADLTVQPKNLVAVAA